MAYATHWEPHGVWQHYFDTVTGAQRVAGVGAVLGDRRFDQLRYYIVDYTGTTRFDFTDAELIEVFALHLGAMRTNPRLYLALVIASPQALPAHKQMMQIGRLPPRVKVVDTLAEARDWIAGELGRLGLDRQGSAAP